MFKENQNKSDRCNCCQGSGFVRIKVKNLATLDYTIYTDICAMCHGKGYVTREDMNRIISPELLYQYV